MSVETPTPTNLSTQSAPLSSVASQLNLSTEEPWWTTINPDDVYYYDGNPRGARPFLNVIPYKSFLRDTNFALITIPIFAAITGFFIILCILTRMNRCCFGLFEIYPIRPAKKSCLPKRWLSKVLGFISPCFRKQEYELYCACHGTRECNEQKFVYREDSKTIKFLTEDEIQKTFKVCKCDVTPEPVQEIKRYFMASERNVRFDTEVTVVNPPADVSFKETTGKTVTLPPKLSTAKSTFVKSWISHDRDNDVYESDDETTSSLTTTGTESI